MSSYRTRKRAVVHPVKSARAFKPYCDLVFKDTRELKAVLVAYMRPYCQGRRVEVDATAGAILVDGVHVYDYELIEPAPVKAAAAVMY